MPVQTAGPLGLFPERTLLLFKRGFSPAQVSLCNFRQVSTSLDFTDGRAQEFTGPSGSASRASDLFLGFLWHTPVPVCEAGGGDEGVAGSADSRNLLTWPSWWPLLWQPELSRCPWYISLRWVLYSSHIWSSDYHPGSLEGATVLMLWWESQG